MESKQLQFMEHGKRAEEELLESQHYALAFKMWELEEKSTRYLQQLDAARQETNDMIGRIARVNSVARRSRSDGF